MICHVTYGHIHTREESNFLYEKLLFHLHHRIYLCELPKKNLISYFSCSIDALIISLRAFIITKRKIAAIESEANRCGLRAIIFLFSSSLYVQKHYATLSLSHRVPFLLWHISMSFICHCATNRLWLALCVSSVVDI